MLSKINVLDPHVNKISAELTILRHNKRGARVMNKIKNWLVTTVIYYRQRYNHWRETLIKVREIKSSLLKDLNIE